MNRHHPEEMCNCRVDDAGLECPMHPRGLIELGWFDPVRLKKSYHDDVANYPCPDRYGAVCGETCITCGGTGYA